MNRLIAFPALLVILSACAPTCSTPTCLEGLAAAQRTDAYSYTQAATQAAPFTQSALEQATAGAQTATAYPLYATGQAISQNATGLAATQMWEGATATVTSRDATEVYAANVANEAYRQAEAERRLHEIEQQGKEFNARFWPVFWPVFWTVFAAGLISGLVIFSLALSAKERSSGDAEKITAQAKAEAEIIRAQADAREKDARSFRFGIIPIKGGGVWVRNDAGRWEYIEHDNIAVGVSAITPPLPEIEKGDATAIGAPDTYPPTLAGVLNYLDRCIELSGGRGKILPTAEQLANSTLRNAGLPPLESAGLVITQRGQHGGSRVVKYGSINELRSALAEGVEQLPHSAEVYQDA